MPEALDVTVVVPVRDMDGLGELVAALRGQSLGVDRFEVVIADDGSRRPLDVEPDGEWLRVDRAAPANSYAARNRGARLARGRVLAFCDADCRPAPDWLEHGLAAVDDGAGLVAGEVRPRRPRRVTAWALLDADDSFNQERVVAEGYALGGNVFVRRDVFDRLGGFDETRPSGGDFELARRAVSAGERLVYARDAVVTHPTLDDARTFLRRAWFRERHHALRDAVRCGPFLAQLPKLVPVVGPLVARKKLGWPLGLDRSRIRWVDTGTPRLRIAVALAIRYLVLPYVAAAARTVAALASPTREDGTRRTAVAAGGAPPRAAREG